MIAIGQERTVKEATQMLANIVHSGLSTKQGRFSIQVNIV